MGYRLRYDRRLLRQLEDLPADVRSIARRQISSLANDPLPSGAKELDRHPGYYRLRLPRNHRLVYEVVEDVQIVDILYLSPKPPDLYEQLGLGRPDAGRES